MKKKTLKIIQTVAFIGLGVFFIFFFWDKLDAGQQDKVINNFLGANYFWVLLAIAAGILSHILRAARWNLLIETFEKPPTTGQSFWSLMAGYLANLAVPRLGEITRAVLLSKQSKIPFDKLFGTVVAERAFDFFFYIALFFTAVSVFWHNVKTYVTERLLGGLNEKTDVLFGWKIWIVFGVLAALFLVFLWVLKKFRHVPLIQKIRRIIQNLLSGLLSIFKLKRTGLFFVYTILIWTMYWLMIYLMYFSVPSSSSLTAESAFMVLVFGTIGIIVIQGGIGIYPLIVSEVLLIYGADITDGFTIGWLSWTVQTVLILVLGLIAFIMVNIQKKNKDGLQTTDK
ncbi:hypothetical protein SDC9_50256 [bioreactor metagenome]|uniref:Lysylphosphatidylglycerol synthase TM region n=1 Tax=bioreactor metagenome TaxID=1076179 RepID=A0A644WK47_9ZZZZ